ncbi:Alpha/Beta hydrolase protein [Rhizoctonia solani]|nr:Alpha/Beta hydrolase protein [Rhizoctonia solani]
MAAVEVHPLGYKSKVAHLSTGPCYRYVDIHPPEGVKPIVTALVLHGFPDTASQPTNPEDYAPKRQGDELEELVHQARISQDERIIVIAHDAGAGIANRLIQRKPELVKGAINFCVPFMPPSRQYIPMEKYIELFPNFQYQAFFASPESTAIIDANVDQFMMLIYASAKQGAAGQVPSLEKAGVIEAWLNEETKMVMPELLSQEELNTMLSEINAGVGFEAMLNNYRARKINYEFDKDLPQVIRPDIPKLMVIPSVDPAIPAALSVQAEKNLKNIEVAWLEGLCGHWVQLEKPQEVEKIVGEWVQRFAAKDWIP